MAGTSEDKNYGEGIVGIFSANKIFLAKAKKMLKDEFPEIDYTNIGRGCDLYTFQCRYTLEDSIYPVLKKIAEMRTAENDLILGYGLFLENLYSEEMVIYKDEDFLRVNHLKKLTEEEKTDIDKQAKRYQKQAMNACLNSMKADEERRNKEKEKLRQMGFNDWDKLKQTRSEKVQEVEEDYRTPLLKVYLSWMEDTVSEELEKIQQSSDKHICFAWPNREFKVYLTKNHETYYAEEMQLDRKNLNMVYIPFARFLVTDYSVIPNYVKQGWFFRLQDGSVQTYATPYETGKEKEERIASISAVKMAIKENFSFLFV